MKPEKIILAQEENVVSLVDTSTTKIKQNINPVNDIHCTSMLVPSNKSMLVVTTTSVETIMETVPTFNPLSVQTIPTTMISSSKDFPVTTLSSSVKVSTSKNIQTPVISAIESIYLNENNRSNLSSSSTMTSHFDSVVQSSPLEKPSPSITSSLNAIPNSNSAESSSAIETISSSSTSRINGSTLYTFTSSHALPSSVTKIDAQTSLTGFSSISTKLLAVTSYGKKVHNIAVRNSPVAINQTDISQNVQNGSSISLPFTSQLVTPNIQLMKAIPSLISLDNASNICSTQLYKLPSSSTFGYSMVSKTVNTFTLRTQMTSSVMSSNIDKVLNNTPVTSNIQNVLFTATTTSPNTMHEIHSKVSPVMPIYTSLAPVLPSNITARKPTKESSLSTAIFSAKVNLEETSINREDIKTHKNYSYSQIAKRNTCEYEEREAGKTTSSSRKNTFRANRSKENVIVSVSGNKTSSLRNQSNAFTTQYSS